MTDHRQLRPPWFSRRRLLRRALGFAGAATILGSTAGRATAQVKISQKAVAYQPQPNGDKRCDKCLQFQPPSACKIVEGTISPQGWCKVFVAKPK